MKWIALLLAVVSLMFGGGPVYAAQVPPAQLEHKVTVWVSKDVAPAQKIRININTQNLAAVQLTAQKVLDPIAWFLSGTPHQPQQARPGESDTPPQVGKVVGKWPMSMLSKGEKPTPLQTIRYYSRQINLPPLPPGVYKITASGGGVENWAVVNVTNLAVVTKRSNYKTLVWVTDAITGANVGGADVTKYETDEAKPMRMTTDAKGIALFSHRARLAKLIVTRGNDRALLPIEGPLPGDEPRVHFQTDRPVYRPGQTVQYKAIVRMGKGADWENQPNLPVSVQVRDPKEEVLDQQDLKTNALGTVSGSFDIPSEAGTGPYSLVLTSHGEDSYATFTVADYRKPEYKVDMQPAANRYLAGQDIQFNVNTAYYFGAPLQQAQVHYVVRRSPLFFWSSNQDDELYYSGDGNMYPSDEYSANEVAVEDITHTDDQGNAVITVKTDPKRPDMTYSIAADVTDSSRRQVNASASVPVYAAAVRIGLRSDLYYVPLGGLIPIQVNAQDLDGKPVPAAVTLELSEMVWNDKMKLQERVVLAKTTVNVPSTGKALAKLPARAQGDLLIDATAPDKTGRIAKASMDMYVAGPSTQAEKDEESPELRVRLDRKSYKAGDVVKANVSSNFKGSSILIVAEGEDVFDYAVLPAGSANWTLKTSRAMSPNAYITATQWDKGQMVSSNQILPLPDSSRFLTVKAEPDKKNYRPGENASYKIRSTDSSGKPVAAEVALSVVDEAIYALRGDSTPDIVKFYWGMRENRVSTLFSAPEEVSGGAYQRVNPAAPVRQRFEDTAYWNPTVETDASGEATVNFQMPDNLTSWRATARGVTAATQVGVGSSMVAANRPVMMRLATPRQMVVGDQLAIVTSVNNRTDTPRDFKTLVDADGLSLAGSNGQTLTVAPNSEGHVLWSFSAEKMPESGRASILGTTEPVGDKNPDFSDALKVGFPIIPKGVLERSMSAGMAGDQTTVDFNLPDDRIEPASTVEIDVWSGLQPAILHAVDSVLGTYRYGPPVAADQLVAASLKGESNKDDEVREALAELSRTDTGIGWGWWGNQQSDPRITAHVLSSFAAIEGTNVVVSDRMKMTARYAAIQHYNRSQLWDTKAILAAALTMAKAPEAADKMGEVLRRGIKMSPYARLKLAEALAVSGDKADGEALAKDAISDAVIGPASARVPAGEGIGWEATDTETTAQALLALHALGEQPDLQSKLAFELAQPSDSGWQCNNDQIATALALSAYVKDHPDAAHLGDVKVIFNGTDVPVSKAKIENSASFKVPSSALQTGNTITLSRSGGGEAFYQVRAATFRPLLDQRESGISVLRRFEAMSANGVWHQLGGEEPVVAGDPIRCTVLIWGHGVNQATRISEPIPAGFEYVQDESSDDGVFEQVRDGSVEHYVMTSSEPSHFTYYLRAESTGKVTALPATAELLRDPAKRGQSSAESLQIRDK